MKMFAKLLFSPTKKLQYYQNFQSYLFQTNIFNDLTIYKNIIEHYVRLADIFVQNVLIYVNNAFNNDL